MEQVLYIILGGLLTIIGGFMSQRYTSHLNQIKEDEGLLFKALCALNDYKKFPSDYKKSDEELWKFVICIKSKRYKRLSAGLLAFTTIITYEKKEKHVDFFLSLIRKTLNKKLDKKDNFYLKMFDENRIINWDEILSENLQNIK